VRITILMALAAAGCSFHTSNSTPTDGKVDGKPIDGRMIDAPPDAPPDAPRQDFGTGTWAVHVDLPVPTNTFTLPMMINTDAASTDCMNNVHWVDASQPTSVCFIVAQDINTNMTVNVRGANPLVLVATNSITIGNDVDVASHRSQPNGPGANAAACGSPGSGANRNMGAGGGAGGSFVTKGGDGGHGDSGQASPGTATAALGTPTILQGGCPGSSGGNGDQNSGAVGAGGGALYMVAGTSITISATGLVNASGAGAGAGGHHAGGSGAGTGGMIVLYAPAITAAGKILANGGGGAGGGNGGNGTNGMDEAIGMPLAAPPGGQGPGGNGGNGFTQGIMAAGGGDGGGGNAGGGGGGGAGYIRSNLALPNVNAVTPAVDVVP
jgi:hypothetical protein